MTSSYQRNPLGATIRQDRVVVGAICLPEDETQDFIDEFNHCYGPLDLQVEAPVHLPYPRRPLLPVGARKTRYSGTPLAGSRPTSPHRQS